MKLKLTILLAAIAGSVLCRAQDDDAAAQAAADASWERLHNLTLNAMLRGELESLAAQAGRGIQAMDGITPPSDPPPDDGGVTNDVGVFPLGICPGNSGSMTFTGMKRLVSGPAWVMPRKFKVLCGQTTNTHSSFSVWTNAETIHQNPFWQPSTNSLFWPAFNQGDEFDRVYVEFGPPYFYTNGVDSSDVGTFTYAGYDQFSRPFTVSTNASMDLCARAATFTVCLHYPCDTNDPPLLLVRSDQEIVEPWKRPPTPPNLQYPDPDYHRPGGGGPNLGGREAAYAYGTNGLVVLVASGVTNGMSYTVEASASVGDDASWSDVMTFTADDPEGYYVFSVPTEGDMRFYRLRQNQD